MKKNYKQSNPYNYSDEIEHIFDEEFAVASSTDFTGLIPAAPHTSEEANSYDDIYNPVKQATRSAKDKK